MEHFLKILGDISSQIVSTTCDCPDKIPENFNHSDANCVDRRHLMFLPTWNLNHSPDWRISSIHDVGLSSASSHELNHVCGPSQVLGAGCSTGPGLGLSRRSEFVLFKNDI